MAAARPDGPGEGEMWKMRNVWKTAAGLYVASCAVSMPVTAQQPPANQGPIASDTRGVTVKLDDLEDKPENFVGKTVTVQGEVDKMLGPHLFTVDERGWADPARELPVSVPAPFTVTLKEKAMVRITGTVEKVPIAKLENEVGPITDTKLRAEIENRPVLVATAVTDTAGKSLLTRKGS
jgi:hypothetical protein